ncbi:TSC22 domain family protein 4 [Amia ocellicauda]|uniref:TSC22 domain family protein 4 n=1 Tax=Amia ocellicauda TaxID=2972642 RepID=UPI003464C921
MSGGKKKSGFQITSVTTDYQHVAEAQADGVEHRQEAEAEPQPGSGPAQPPPLSHSPKVMRSNSLATSRDLAQRQAAGAAWALGGPRGAGDSAVGLQVQALLLSNGRPAGGHRRAVGGTQINGPGFLDTAPVTATSSHPGTPVLMRKQASLDPALMGQAGRSPSPRPGLTSPPASRFRVVRLGQALGEPYRRGRWTCVDFFERDFELQAMGRLLDSTRHALSLDSLETVGLGGGPGGAGGGLGAGKGGGGAGKPLGPLCNLKAGHLVHSQGTTHVLAPTVAAGNARRPLSGSGGGDQKPLSSGSGPSSPRDRPTPPSLPLPPEGPRLPLPPPSPRQRLLPPPLQLELDRAGRVLLRESRSGPSSPAPPRGRDGSPRRTLSPSPSPARLSLAQSMFGAGGAFDLEDESGSSNSMIAIDNKIEQAMDLVKTHLLWAVREEVELLREQIRELLDKNAQLEKENEILRALTHRD